VLGLLGLCSLTDAVVAEIIGPYKVIDAPVQAQMLGGGGVSFNWLNVVNTPVSIQEAFTGFSIIADGYANANAGTTFLLTYAPGVLRNDPGPDLVLFDAGGTGNQYIVYTSYNNFNHPILVFPSVDTGEDRTYFYGGTGPQTYDVKAAVMDLSQFGVPAGATVSQVRVFTEGGSCDLLGVGVLLSTCPSDIDGNGSVGSSDAALLVSALGSVPGAASWNPRADLNADGAVNLRDVAKFQADFGSACP